MSEHDYELEDSPGMGHNGGPQMDEAAWEEQKVKRQELLLLDEKSLAQRARKVTLVNLLMMVEDGTATAQDMNVLRALLKDNGMIMGDPLEGGNNDSGTPSADQAVQAKRPLPQFDEPEYDP